MSQANDTNIDLFNFTPLESFNNIMLIDFYVLNGFLLLLLLFIICIVNVIVNIVLLYIYCTWILRSVRI